MWTIFLYINDNLKTSRTLRCLRLDVSITSWAAHFPSPRQSQTFILYSSITYIPIRIIIDIFEVSPTKVLKLDYGNGDTPYKFTKNH
jgi:hypothetical protein